jgi:predicted TIM-barrel fold metal-dependent hydrolase
MYTGFFDRFPRMKVIIPHLGGALPFLKGRIDYSSRYVFGIELDRKPSEYIGNLYFDIVSNDPATLEFMYHYVGAEHLLFASDHPYWALDVSVLTMEQANIPAEDRQRIFGQNALDVMKISLQAGETPEHR